MPGKQLFAIYSRKSKYTGKGDSIGNQIEICREYIRVHYGTEEADGAVVYEDEGFSGGNLNRPRFCAMMDAARKEKYRAIVVYRLDRISRNIGDFANLICQLEGDGIDFISVKEQFDTGSPMGRAMMYISSVFSQLERETIAERIRDNLRELAKTGQWLGGMTPTGYASTQTMSSDGDGRQRKACMLQEIPEELQVVEMIFYEFIKERSLTKLDAYLMNHGCRTKNGNEFSRFAIKGILTNPVYMIADEDAWQYLTGRGVQLAGDRRDFDGIHGIMAYNRTLQRKGKAHQIKPMEEWIVAVGKHPGKIPGKVWIEAQELLAQNCRKSYRRPRNHTALLPGMLRCGNCKGYMRPKMGRSVLDGGERRYSYLCIKKERSRGQCCAVGNVDGNMLDSELIRWMKGLSENRAVFARELENGKKRLREMDEPAGRRLWERKREIKENEERIGCLVKTLSLVPEETKICLLGQIEELNKKNQQLHTQVKADAEEAELEKIRGAGIGNLPKIASSFENLMDALTTEQKRDVIHMLVREVVWDGENIHVICRGSTYRWECDFGEPLGKDSK